MLENIELFGNSLGTGTYPDGEGKSFLQNIFDVIHPVGETYIQYPAQKSPQEIYNKKDANNRIIIDSVWEEQLQYNSAFFRSEHLLDSYIYKANDETQYYLIDNLNNLTPINIAGNSGINIAGSPTSGQQKVIGDKTYQAYAVSGVNSSSNNYIEEGNNLSIQSYQNAYHNHGGNTGGQSNDHSHTRGNMEISGYFGRVCFYNKISATGAFALDDKGDSEGGTGSGRYRGVNFYASRTWSGSTSGASQDHTHNISYDGNASNYESRPINYTIRIWKRIS